MRWGSSKQSVLLLAALFCLFSATSWGAECSEGWDHSEREAEDEVLTTILMQLRTTTSEQETKISELETSQKGSEAIISEQATSLTKASKSLKDERAATLGKVLGAGGIGFLVGWFIYWIVDLLIPDP